MIEPLFVLISEFEKRKTRLFMRERLLAKYFARLRNLAHKYEHIPYIDSCPQLLRSVTLLRRSEEKHELPLMAEALIWQSKLNRPADIELTDETPLFLDGVFAELKSEHAVAAADAEVLDSEMLSEEDQEEVIEDNEGFEDQSISFDELEHENVIQALNNHVNPVAAQDRTTRIYQMGCNLIEDFANRSLWDQEKNALCKRQWAEWLAIPILDQRFRDAIDLPGLLFWNVIATSSRWRVPGEYASIVVSLPTSEAENERTFSIRKYVIGKRGARSKNDLVVARIRAKLENSTVEQEI
jgi:hypothetical protein